MRFKDSRPQRDDSAPRIAAYESYLDLFTLLSFILIIAAFIFVSRSSNQISNAAKSQLEDDTEGASVASVSSGFARPDTGVSYRMPEDQLLLVVHREQSSDKIGFVAGWPGVPKEVVVTNSEVSPVLDGMAPVFQRAKFLDIVVHNGQERANAAVYLDLIHWLIEHGHTNYQHSFSGKWK